jgi:hypothetical protein
MSACMGTRSLLNRLFWHLILKSCTNICSIWLKSDKNNGDVNVCLLVFLHFWNSLDKYMLGQRVVRKRVVESDGTGFETRQEQETYFLQTFIPALRPILPNFQGHWLFFSWGLSHWGGDVDHWPPYSSEVRNEWSSTSTPPIGAPILRQVQILCLS